MSVHKFGGVGRDFIFVISHFDFSLIQHKMYRQREYSCLSNRKGKCAVMDYSKSILSSLSPAYVSHHVSPIKIKKNTIIYKD